MQTIARKQALAHLRSYRLTGLTKVADDISGGGQEMPFEQAFAQLAHVYLQDKAPKLLDYELGFQLVDKNDDNSKAVGVHVFKIGERLIYSPVVFINGELKSGRMLYLKSQALFVPLQEAWVSFLISKAKNTFGSNVSKNLQAHGVLPANMHALKYPYGKMSSDQTTKAKAVVQHHRKTAMASWAYPVLPALARAFLPQSPDSHLDLPSFLKLAGRPGCQAFLRLVGDYPLLLDSVAKFYPGEKIAAVMRTIRESEGECHPILGAAKAMKRLSGSVLGDDAEKSGSVRILRLSSLSMHSALGKEDRVADGDKEKLLKGKVVIQDTRPDSKVTRAYKVDQPQQLFNPAEAGLYEILVKPGQFSRCAVFPAPYTSRGTQNLVLVVRLDNKAATVIHPSKIWAKEQVGRSELAKWLKKLPSADSLSSDRSETHVLISQDGKSATAPFTVHRENGGRFRAFEVHFDRSCCVDDRAGSLKSTPMIPVNHPAGEKYSQTIILTAASGQGLKATGHELHAPESARLLTLGSGQPALELDSLADFHLGLKKAAGVPVQISVKQGRYRIDQGQFLGEDDAVVQLVVNHGLREKSARQVLEQASQEKELELYFKYAEPDYPLQESRYGAPPIPEPMMGTDPLLGGRGQAVQEGYTQRIPVDGAYQDNSAAYDQRNAPEPQGLGPAPDQEAAGQAMQAGEMGQKEVFDTAAIGAILKTMKPDSVINQHLGGLMKNLSRLGSMLLNLYWNKEGYSDRLGDEDTRNLEDLLERLFEMQGDLVLQLKEKSANPELDGGALPDMDADGDESDS